ncbi:hypothetical protein B0H19DRAFT_1228000 [Mycena capillaripes]|nr:hypothetical protein B0H19DRAFT_1228000 [Mycena capillaripes]
MMFSKHTALFALSAAISPAHALIVSNNNGRHSTTSRIIGAVVAVVVFFALLALLCIARRRRARAIGGGRIGGFAPAAGGTGKFGGGFNRPWGRNQYGQNQNQAAYQTGGQQSYYPGGPPAAADGSKYPPPAANGEAVPPPYSSGDAGTHQQFNPPPGPPPQAHVNDAQNTGGFVGGFRS